MDTPTRLKGSKTLAQAMFDSRRSKTDQRDTVTSTMLRTLCMNGPMLQADFMRLYHERCARAGNGKSSFLNNFGYLVRCENTYNAQWRGIPTYNQAACIAQRRRLGMTLWARSRHYPQQREPNQLWITLVRRDGEAFPEPPEVAYPDAVLRSFNDGELTMVEQWCERKCSAYEPDDPRFDWEAMAWRKLVMLEFRYRAAQAKDVVPVLFKQVAGALRKAGTRFGDWYDDGGDDFVGPYLLAEDAKAYGRLCEIAEQQDMTVLELLDYEKIQWGAA